jgi:hypothetical protein
MQQVILILFHPVFVLKKVSCTWLSKIKVILFLFSFLLANSGMVVSAHWCGGKLTSISFFSVRNLCACAKEEVAMKPNCCKDQLATFQAGNDLDVTGSSVYKVPGLEIAAIFAPGFEIGMYPLQGSHLREYSSIPPVHPKHPRYLQNRVFRI